MHHRVGDSCGWRLAVLERDAYPGQFLSGMSRMSGIHLLSAQKVLLFTTGWCFKHTALTCRFSLGTQRRRHTVQDNENGNLSGALSLPCLYLVFCVRVFVCVIFCVYLCVSLLLSCSSCLADGRRSMVNGQRPMCQIAAEKSFGDAAR